MAGFNREQDLLASNNRYIEIIRALRNQLRKNTEQFQYYADNHATKGSNIKAHLGDRDFVIDPERSVITRQDADDTYLKAEVNRKFVQDNLDVLTNSY